MVQRVGKHMTASQMIVAGFAIVIFLGGILLSFPVCNADGKWLNFLDALFTSCSAVCVTGLVTIVPAVQFSMPGKVILLLLIQFGGLGLIACTMGVFLILRRQITIRSRVMIQESYSLDTMSGLVTMLIFVLKGTFFVEGMGAFFYAFQFVPQYGLFRGIWYSVFHAVSAFCNAGIDILGDSSLQMYQTNPLINIVTMALILVSGLGFVVWQDLILTAKRIRRKEFTWKRSLQKMRLHTKLAVVMTLALFIGGTVGFFFMEYSNPNTLGPLSMGEKWMAAMFQSVTTRTAGFFTIPQGAFHEESKFLSCILMFIGGAPGGTAGGVKTTTVAILLLTCWSVLKGNVDTECYRRKIPALNVRAAFSVVIVAFLALLAGTMAILLLEPVSLTDALYEVTSAIGTVGLTVGITPLLSAGSKLVLILLMYMGRIGPVTLALLFASKVGKKKHGRKLPEERIVVG
ncbi:MAG: potassium transporter TrkG [Lachnospiraceae bacterium]|nr:potassium transporter TrkG [Lachnospiraceae bacterium]